MTARVFDASWQRPKPSLLQPGDGIILYASRTADKCPSAAECDAYRARGVTVRFVFEDAADRAATGTYDDGHADAALTWLQLSAKGGQAGDAVFFACDTYATLSLDYARGFRDGLHKGLIPRLYAGDRNLELARTRLGMTKGWQAGAASWSDHWNGNHGTYPDASLYQIAGQSPIPGTDLNLINQPDWSGDDVALDPNDPVVQQILTGLRLIRLGDDPDPNTGDTHPDNIQRTRQDLGTFRADMTLRLIDLQAQLDAVKAAVGALSTGGAVAFDVAGTLTPKP